MDDFSAWIGREERAADIVSAAQLAGLAALLDYPDSPWESGDAPLLGHWLHFLPRARQSDIDEDGHPRRGGFLPPVPLPRRMWAGGRLDFHAPLTVGAPVERRSTIADIRRKSGASGELVFVTVRHDVLVDGTLAVVEEQDLVYREEGRKPAPGAAPPPPPAPARDGPVADVVRMMTPDPVQLFRFSALTFNAHRIHYDRDYARDVEGYAGLVVHGPYLATLLMDHFRCAAPDRIVRRFAFRAQAPLLDTAPFDLCLAWSDEGAKLWTRDALGQATMLADIVAD